MPADMEASASPPVTTELPSPASTVLSGRPQTKQASEASPFPPSTRPAGLRESLTRAPFVLRYSFVVLHRAALEIFGTPTKHSIIVIAARGALCRLAISPRPLTVGLKPPTMKSSKIHG